MAFTAITVPGDTSGSITPVAADGSNGNKYQNDGKLRLLIHNPNASAIVCTIAIPSTSDTAIADGNVIADLVISTSATYYLVKPLRKDIYNTQSGTDKDAVTMTWSGTLTGVVLTVI